MRFLCKKLSMTVLVVANDAMRSALGEPTVEVNWVNEIGQEAIDLKPVVCIDLLFDNSQYRRQQLHSLGSSLVIVNSVIDTLAEIDNSFVRVNAWPGFLTGNLIEAVSNDAGKKEMAERIFTLFGKKLEWVTDIPGMLTPRIIASIINEAYFTLEEDVSTKDEIDVAMKLGTNYPYGPFEWSSMIGLSNIHQLLTKLSLGKSRYVPSQLLTKEAGV